MRVTKTIVLVLLPAIFLTSCAKIFYSPDAKLLAKKQKVIAIIPPTVSIAARKKVDPEAIKEQQKTESINFQKEMYSWLLKRKMQGKFFQEIQEVETTIAKLKKAGYPETHLSTVELCQVLEVDGILTSNYALSKPISEAGAIVVAVLVGAWGATNEVHVTLGINDCLNKKTIWNYDHKFSGGLGSNPSRLVDGLMRHASKKMPYFVE